MNMFKFIDSQWNVFAVYPNIDKYLEIRVLFVNINYRGCGIATMLVERTAEYVRAHNIPLMFVMPSSIFTAKACERNKFKQVYQLNFADYFVDGKNPIVPPEPHNAMRILVREM